MCVRACIRGLSVSEFARAFQRPENDREERVREERSFIDNQERERKRRAREREELIDNQQVTQGR